jgi:hypothetical protein
MRLEELSVKHTRTMLSFTESITLKESSNVPKISEEYGMTEDQFAEQLDLLRQYKAGNFQALEG